MKTLRYLLLLLFYCFFYLFQLSAINDLGVRKVVIDAGHGGKDVGCLGSKINEKEITLSIALKLGKIIEENFTNVEVIYTRKTDEFIELHERARIANDNHADLFICIHANSGNKSAYGVETFVMGLHKSEANLRVAQRENSSILMEEKHEIHYEGFDPNSPESYIALSVMQSAFLEQSLNLSDKIQKQLVSIGRNNRGVKQAGFLVLYKTTMPSVLIETGFLSHKEEEAFLVKEENQVKIANAIFNAFKEYKQEIEKRIVINDANVEMKDLTTKENTTNNLSNTKQKKENELIFKVQIFSSSQKIPLDSANFNGLENVNYYQDSNLYKYTLGNEKDLVSISALLQKAREKGYKDAFIVVFLDGNRIDLGKALNMLKNK